MKKIKEFLKKSFYALLILSILMVQIDFTFIYAESKGESVEEGVSKESSQEEKEVTSDEKDENENLLDQEESNGGNVESEEGNKDQEESEEIKEGNENKENEKGEGDTSKDDINKDEKDEDELVNEIENEETDSSIFTYDESGTIITGFSGSLPKDKIVFPKEHNGKTIVGIGEKAFEGKGISGELIFPETYTEIDSHAFKNNKIDSISIPGETYIGVGAFEKNNIKKLDLPMVKKIDRWAFEGNLLESANLPEVESIGEYSFGNYPGAINENKIEELYLPSIKEIDEKAFQGANTKVNLSGEISPNLFSYIEVDGKLKILGFKNNNLSIKGGAKFPSETNDGKPIIVIGDNAFKGKAIEGHISFPETYEEIGKWAFKGNQIISVDVKGVRLIEEGALENNNIKHLDLEDVEELGPWAFAGNPLEEASGNKLKKIGYNAFGGISLELNLKGELSPELFSYDEDIKITGTYFLNLNLTGDIEFPSKANNGKAIVGIGESAFEGKGIEGSISFPESYEKIEKWAFKSNNITSISILGKTDIGEGAFEKNNLTELDLPEVTTIGPWAFEGNLLEKIGLPKVETVGEYAFNENSISGKLYLPEVTIIGSGAFEGNEIENINLPKVELIGESAFDGNTISGELNLPEVKEIGERAFNRNNISGELNLPKATKIGKAAFEKNKLSKLDLPEVTIIGPWAFEGNLLEGISLPEVEAVGEYAFNENSISGELNLPKVEEIGPWAFEGNEIENIKLPKVTTIGEVAFSNNKLSGELNLQKLENVGNSAFQNNRIEKLDSPNLEEIGDYGFADNKLKEVIAPKLSRLGEWALVGDDHELKSLTIYNKLELVSLSSLYMPNKEHLGNFPIYINNSEEKNTIDTDHRIVYNPSDNFKEIYLGSLDNNQEYIWTSVDDFVMGTDRNNNSYYCVDHETPMKQGIYDIYEDVNTIYIIEHGEQNEKGQKVSLDEKPDSYKYSYDGALVSSLITNYYELIEEYEDSIDTGRIYNIIYPVASNPYVEEQVHLTRDNFFDIVIGTDMYKNIYSYEKDGEIKEDEILKKFIVELYERVQNDERDYSKLSYLILSDIEDNIVNLSQSLVKPGEPEDPKKPNKPIIPEPEEPEEPDKPEDPEEPDKPEDPEEPDKPEDPEEPEKPEEPEEPDKPEDPEEPDKPEDPEEPDKPEDPEEPDKPEDPEEPDKPEDPDRPDDLESPEIPEEDEGGNKNPNKPDEDDEDEDQSWKKPINPNNPGNETSNDEEGRFSLPKTGQSDSLLLLTVGMFLIFLGIKVDKKYE